MSARRSVLSVAVWLCVSMCLLVFGSAVALAGVPVVSGESVVDVGSTNATVLAQVDPEGLPATYMVEYGTSSGYGSASVEVDLPASAGPVGVQQKLSGLSAGVEYHFRVVARNAAGGDEGADAIFNTPISGGPSTSALPDGRVYEQVSAPGEGEVYVPTPSPGQKSEQDIATEFPFRSASDGNSMVYLGDPPGSGQGGNGNQGSDVGNQYLAVRSPKGWEARTITPPGTYLGTSYEVFSSDLSIGVIQSIDESPEFPPLAEEVSDSSSMFECDVLYSHVLSTSSYHALFTTTQIPHDCGEPMFVGANEGTGVVPEYSHVLFQTQAPLVPGVAAASGEGRNLYDSVDGQLYVVNVLPDGSPASGSVFGGYSGESEVPDFDGVISADGSRVFWTDLSSGEVYARENDTQPQSPLGGKGECLVPGDACTVPVSAGAAEYWAATPEGKYAFYTEGGSLWRFDVQTLTHEQLAGPSAEVQGVVGINETGEEGAYLYSVANGVLGKGANPEGREPVAGQPNLYLYREGESEPTFIATLAAGDNGFRWNSQTVGDWQTNLGKRTAEVTPDGHSVGFLSTQPLTGYDNLIEGSPVLEVFVYDEASGRIACASCTPDGEPPASAPRSIYGGRGETGVQVSSQPTYMMHWISDDGNRVFFDSPQALVSQDITRRQDVYEWERNGEGSCRQDANCVYLLSGGDSEDLSYFVGASATGDDVFFTHRGKLVSQLPDGEETDLYDARVEGGFPETSLSCTGTGCQGVPPAPPIFATPSSVTFNGVGNFAQPSPVPAKTKPKSKPAECRKGFVRKHRRCVRPKRKVKKVKARRSSANREGRS